MTRLWYFSLLALAVNLFAAAASKPSVPAYDPKAEVKVRGTVEDVSEFTCPVTGALEHHLVLKTDSEVVQVHVAPVKFMKRYEISFAKGDEIEVTGVRVTVNDKAGIVAREIVRGQSSLDFRDKGGKPYW